jgi:hypothetical protein
MTLLSAVMLAVGVGDQPQVTKDPSQPGWVESTRRFDQDRFGLDTAVVGEVAGAVGEHAGMHGRDRSLGQGLGGAGQGATEQGPSGADGTGGSPGA